MHINLILFSIILGLSQVTCDIYCDVASLREEPSTHVNASPFAKLLRASSCGNVQCIDCSSFRLRYNISGINLPEVLNQLLSLKSTMSSHPNKTCTSKVCQCKDSNLTIVPYSSNGTVVNFFNFSSCFPSFNGTRREFYDLGYTHELPWDISEVIPANANIPNAKFRNETKSSKRSTEATSSDFIVTFSQPTISVNTEVADDYFVIWNFRSFSGFWSSEGGSSTQELDGSLLVQTATLTVDVYYNRTMITTSSFSITKEDSCTVHECAFICWDYFTHYLCYSLTTQVLVAGSFLISSILLMVAILYMVYKCVLMTSCQSMWSKIGSAKAQSAITGKPMVQILFGSDAKDEGVSMESLESESSIEEVLATTKSSRDGRRIPKVLALILLITLLSPVGAECLASTSIDSNIVQCSTQGGTRTCSVSVNTQISLPYLGSSACFTFIDKFSNTPVGTLKVTYSRMVRQVLLNFRYWTNKFSLVSQTQHFCSATNDLCTSGSCSCINYNSINHFPGTLGQYPGWTVCESVPGCAGNGCVSCSQAEILGRIAMSLYGEALYVSSIQKILSLPEIIVETTFNGQTTTQTVTVGQGPHLINGLSVTFLGEVDNSPTIVFGDNAIIGNSSGIWMYPASTTGSPVMGAIGEIQSPYHDWLEFPPFNSEYPVDPPHYSIAENVIYLPSRLSAAVKLLREDNQFPLYYAGIYWDATPNYLLGIDPSPGSVELFVSSPSNFNTQFEVTAVCPEIQFLQMNGCFSCTSGATLIISARSTCDTGSLILEVSTTSRITVFQKSILVSLSFSNSSIPIFSLDRYVEVTVTLHNGDHNASASGSWTLDPPPKIQRDDINWTGSGSEGDGSSLSFSEWWDSLTGPLSVAKWIISVILGIVALTFVIGIIYVLFHFCKTSVVNVYHVI